MMKMRWTIYLKSLTVKLIGSFLVKQQIVAAEGGIIFVGRDEVKKLVLKIDYHVTEKTRGG